MTSLKRIAAIAVLHSIVNVPFWSTPCYGDLETVESARFSPDSHYAAYVRATAETRFPIGGSEIVGHRAEFFWSRAPTFKTWKSVLLFPQDPAEHEKRRDVYVEYAFSPDSSRVAAASKYGVVSIDLANGNQRVLDERPVDGSPLWVSANSIAFTRYQFIRSSAGRDRTITYCVQSEGGDGGRATDRAAAVVRGDLVARDPLWSPKGRYSLIYPSGNTAWQLVDLQTGEIRSFGNPAAGEATASWRSDEGALICACASRECDEPEAYRVDTVGGTIVEVSKQFDALRAVAKGDGLRLGRSWFRLGPQWTWDDRGLVFRELCWIVELGNWIPKRVDEKVSAAGEKPPRQMWRSPVPGWYLVHASANEWPSVIDKLYGISGDLSSHCVVNEARGTAVTPGSVQVGQHEYLSPDGRFVILSRPYSSEAKVVRLAEALTPDFRKMDSNRSK